MEKGKMAVNDDVERAWERSISFLLSSNRSVSTGG
jgi:hypothetical protein